MDTTTETQELYKGFERSNDFMGLEMGMLCIITILLLWIAWIVKD
jgi:hypothetical protein